MVLRRRGRERRSRVVGSAPASRSGRRSLRPLGLLTVLVLVALSALAAVPAAAQSAVRVVAYNIKHGQGMDDRLDLERLAQVLAELDADVITLQEVDDRTERTGGVDQVALLAERLGYRGFHGPHRPYQGGYYGNGVLARLPVRRVVTHPIPPVSGSALAVLEVEVETSSGASLSVVSVHLAGSTEERLAQADAVTGFFVEEDHPVVLAGDFNGQPAGPVLERLRADWRVIPKSGDPFTYPADTPSREIDFVMVRRIDPVEFLEHHVVPEPLASDHRPIVVTILISGHGPRCLPTLNRTGFSR